jgi:uncharacterized repeat protein (TIGR01451 family)
MRQRSQRVTFRASLGIVLGLGLIVAAVMPVAAQVVTTCPAALETTQLFSFSGTGSAATFTVPANVNSIRIIAVGADGGERTSASFAGGAGARAEGTFAVTPGQVITAIAGQSPTGANDLESGGGGASGAYLGTTLAVIAGGGGGDDNTGNGGGGTATTAGSNGGNPVGTNCNAGGLGGTGGAGGQFGEVPDGTQTNACQTGNGGGGGGGLNSAGGSSFVQGTPPARRGPRGGAQCSIAGAAGGQGGLADPDPGDAIGAAGGFGICGGGGADHRESGGGGGYSGGGGGPEGQLPGGGGSFVASTATGAVLTAGANGGGSGRNGSVRLCYTTQADLTIAKTNTPLAGASDQIGDTVTAGSSVSYSVVVRNNGGASANGTVVTDPSPTNATCSTASCTAAGGATCPTATGAALLAALQSAGGVIVPVLPATGSVTFVLNCVVP